MLTFQCANPSAFAISAVSMMPWGSHGPSSRGGLAPVLTGGLAGSAGSGLGGFGRLRAPGSSRRRPVATSVAMVFEAGMLAVTVWRRLGIVMAIFLPPTLSEPA